MNQSNLIKMRRLPTYHRIACSEEHMINTYPTGMRKQLDPPPLTECQARKITPDQAVLARVRSRRCFYWKALRAEAVGTSHTKSESF